MVNNLIHDDCINVMQDMEPDLVDLTVTSPPYDDLRSYEDSIVWGESVWKTVIAGLYRVTKVGGVVVWIVSDQTIKGDESGTSFKQALWAKECGFRLHDTMIWDKCTFSSIGHFVGRRYGQVFEYMFIFSKGKLKTFNPIRDRRTISKVGHSGRGAVIQRDGERRITPGYMVKKYSARFNIWKQSMSRVRIIGDDKNDHPARFPLKLAHDHIKTWSNKGELVFDPFMGSGTTGKMAKLLGRYFIGVEKVRKYHALSESSILDTPWDGIWEHEV